MYRRTLAYLVSSKEGMNPNSFQSPGEHKRFSRLVDKVEEYTGRHGMQSGAMYDKTPQQARARQRQEEGRDPSEQNMRSPKPEDVQMPESEPHPKNYGDTPKGSRNFRHTPSADQYRTETAPPEYQYRTHEAAEAERKRNSSFFAKMIHKKTLLPQDREEFFWERYKYWCGVGYSVPVLFILTFGYTAITGRGLFAINEVDDSVWYGAAYIEDEGTKKK